MGAPGCGAAGRPARSPPAGSGCLGPVRIWPGRGVGTGLAGTAAGFGALAGGVAFGIGRCLGGRVGAVTGELDALARGGRRGRGLGRDGGGAALAGAGGRCDETAAPASTGGMSATSSGDVAGTAIGGCIGTPVPGSSTGPDAVSAIGDSSLRPSEGLSSSGSAAGPVARPLCRAK
jgi:hypothetical protein